MEVTWKYGLELTFQGICCKQERKRCLLGGVGHVVDKRAINRQLGDKMFLVLTVDLYLMVTG